MAVFKRLPFNTLQPGIAEERREFSNYSVYSMGKRSLG